MTGEAFSEDTLDRWRAVAARELAAVDNLLSDTRGKSAWRRLSE